MNSDSSKLLALIHASLNGNATDEQITRLNTLLRTDADARDLYLQLADTHSCLAVDERLWVDEKIDARPSAAAIPKFSHERGVASFFARPIAAAIVGLAIGLFSASVVFAYVIPRVRAGTVRVEQLFTESFEDETMAPQRGFPSQAGVWSGDLSGSIPAESDMKPKHGERMVRLAPHDKRKFSYAWRIVDLNAYPMPKGAKAREIEVTASFHGATSGISQRYQIRLAAFSEEHGEVKAIWNSDNMFDEVLQHVGRTVATDPDDSDWQPVHAAMEIPQEARSLVISLAATTADDSAPKATQYLDDIRIQFIIHEGSR